MKDMWPAGRDRGITIAIDGFFAMAWFGWGQAGASAPLAAVLWSGTVLAALLTLFGVVVTGRAADRALLATDPTARRRYGLIVGLEFTIMGAGAAALGAVGQYRWVPVLICFGVGLHFFPLAPVLRNSTLRLLGVLLILVAAAAAVVGIMSKATLSLIVGPGAGLSLLVFGVATLLAVTRVSSQGNSKQRLHHSRRAQFREP